MRRFCVHGVVRGGQVILDIPLDLPDGTVVSVTDSDPDDVVTVGPTDTVEQLAGRMVVADHKMERFRLLNGLEQGDKLSPGQPVKIVVE